MKYLLFLVFSLFSTGLLAKEVSFATTDHATIYAQFQQRGPHAVLLAHGAIFNKESWGEFEQRLVQENYSVLAIDFRGYGKSTQGDQSRALYADILAAVQFLKAKQGVRQITVLGASMGAAAAAKASVLSAPGAIDQLILLSPASVYHAENLKGELLFIASEGEYLVKAVQSAFKKAPEAKQIVLIPGSAHAQHIFKTAQARLLTDHILNFLKGY